MIVLCRFKYPRPNSSRPFSLWRNTLSTSSKKASRRGKWLVFHHRWSKEVVRTPTAPSWVDWKRCWHRYPSINWADYPWWSCKRFLEDLYERYFKNHPELINPVSIVNLVSSSLLGYDDDTGAVRDSIADVWKKKQTPSSTIPSLQVTTENEFDRILLLVLNRFLTDKGIPEGFLKSNYFTLRPQLVQLYQEDPTFRTRLEEALDRVEEEVARDYKMLVNETNRTYLSKYPFEEVARALGIQPSVRGFSASKNKLDTIKQHSLTIPGATQKFTGLQQLSETYTRTPESKYNNVQH